MKPRAKPVEPLFDPILDELYRARDAYARKFKFDVGAICDALARSAHTPEEKSDGAPQSRNRAPTEFAAAPPSATACVSKPP